MFKTRSFVSLVLLLAVGALYAGQDEAAQEQGPEPEQVFVRLTFYPTASLSRYDYNNDLNLYEMRVYAEIRDGSQTGDIIPDVRVTVLSEDLAFQEGRYEKRIVLDKDHLPDKVDISIAVPGRPVIQRNYPLPIWLSLLEPQPAIIDPDGDLPVKWRFSAFSMPVDVRVYDFRKGDSLFTLNNVSDTEVTVPADRIPASTIVRIYVIQSWLFSRFLAGEVFARGSEVNIIPWSQVFVRAR